MAASFAVTAASFSVMAYSFCLFSSYRPWMHYDRVRPCLALTLKQDTQRQLTLILVPRNWNNDSRRSSEVCSCNCRSNTACRLEAW
jgi:hypothetical protein